MGLTYISTTTVQVSDQEQALDFYTSKLGFEKTADQPMGEGLRWLTVGLPGAQTGIVLAKGYGTGAETGPGHFTGLVLACDDIQATYEQLSGRGVHFTEAPTMQPWGMMQALFEDQDGNGYVLVQR
ncbi:MAG TPA: VOC family protein [Ktedonobacterales bacterium]|nr:VOC family protein [Ktedonobacterales bacterium]